MAPKELKEMKAEEKVSAMGDALGGYEAEIYMFVEEKLKEMKVAVSHRDILKELEHGMELRAHHVRAVKSDDAFKSDSGKVKYYVGKCMASVESLVKHELGRREVDGRLGTLINLLIIQYHCEKVKTELKVSSK